VRFKGPGDLVTGTDLLAQDTIQRILAERHPDIGFVGEEGDNEQPADGSYWLVDPLCGTANYAARLPLYAVNIALVEDEQVRLSAVGDGSTGDVYVAERGQGAWLNTSAEDWQRLAVSDASGLISLDTNFPEPSGFNRAFALRVIAAGRWKVRVLATTLTLAYLAGGRLAGAVSAFGGSPVHSAAGLLLAEEAGATVTDEHGSHWQPRSGVQVVAASPSLHHDLLELAQAVRQELSGRRVR
jgi:myo-inositol-1(or 4)-monophosphatase